MAISGSVGVVFAYGSTSDGGVASKCVSSNDVGVAIVWVSTSRCGLCAY